MLVIFDCDGVLVDSEHLAAEVFAQTLRALGLPMTADECFTCFRGHALDDCVSYLQTRFQRSMPSDFRQRLDRATEAAFASRLRAVEGVVRVLERLQRRAVPFCVASNGAHAKIEHSLTTTGLASYFGDNRFSAEDVARGKPAPDLFLHAAQVMGVPARYTRVVEDSPAGVSAALSARMAVYVYAPPHVGQPEGIPHTVPVFDSMTALPALLGAD